MGEERFRVTGYDRNLREVTTLNQGGSYIVRIPTTEISLARESGFTATSDRSQVAEMDVVIICVPAPPNEHNVPDLSYITRSVKSIVLDVHDELLIALGHATYRGTTGEVIVSILERDNPSELRVVRDSTVRTSMLLFPEHEDSGNDTIACRDIPKVIGGCGPAARDLATAVYGFIFNRTAPDSSSATVEMT